MSRLLLIVIALYVLWRVLGLWGRRITREGAGSQDYSRFSGRRRDRSDRGEAEPHRDLVEWVGCGTYVPEDRGSLTADGRVFCSSRCRSEHESHLL